MKYIIQITRDTEITYVKSIKRLSECGASYRFEYVFVNDITDAEEFTSTDAINAISMNSDEMAGVKQIHRDNIKRYKNSLPT